MRLTPFGERRVKIKFKKSGCGETKRGKRRIVRGTVRRKGNGKLNSKEKNEKVIRPCVLGGRVPKKKKC